MRLLVYRCNRCFEAKLVKQTEIAILPKPWTHGQTPFGRLFVNESSCGGEIEFVFEM